MRSMRRFVVALMAQVDSNFVKFRFLPEWSAENMVPLCPAMFAANKGLSNLTAFVDYNNLQIDGTIGEVNSAEPIDKKFEAFNWATIIIDGNNFDEIEEALNKAATIDKPVAIIAKTVKGKGVSYMENAVNWHGAAPNDELYEQAMAELNKTLESLQ